MPQFLLFLTLLFFIFQSNIQAQNSHISGTVQDENTVAMEFVNILLLNASDSTMLKGTISNSEGEFEINPKESGKFLLQYSAIGYVTHYTEQIDFDLENGNHKLPTLQLQPNNTLLEEFSVVAKKPLFEQQIDRTVVNVSQSATSAGATALEVLEKSPGVEVNRSNSQISMLGKNGVVVMINGKINRMEAAAMLQLLQGMNADNIEKIELITTPPANFDAEGNAGIINIQTLQKTTDGHNGSFSLNTAYGRRGRLGGSVNLIAGLGKWTVSADVSSNNRWTQENTFLDRVIQFNDIKTSTDINSYRPAYTGLHNGSLTVDYQISDKTLVSTRLSGYISHWTLDSETETFTSNPMDGLTDFSLLKSDEINHWTHWMTNFHLKHRFNEKSSLALDCDYLYYFANNPTDYSNRMEDGNRNFVEETEFISRKETPIVFQVAKVDYTTSVLNDKLKIEAGLKGTFSTFNNDISVSNLLNNEWVIEPLFTTNLSLDESITAAYFSTDFSLNESTQVKAGLRYEYIESDLSSETEGSLLLQNYGTFFPTIYISKKMSEDKQWQFSYNKRITRPAFNLMAPAFFFFAPNNILAGNPAILPTFTQSVKVDYQWKRWMFSLQFSDEDNSFAWGQPEINAEENIVINKVQNMKDQKTIGFTSSFPIAVTDWWESRYNLGVYYLESQPVFEGVTYKRSDSYFTFNTTQSFQLPKKWELEVGAQYRSELQYGMGQIPVRFVINMGISKSLFKEKGKLTFNWSDIFNTGSFFEIGYNESDINLQYNWRYEFDGSVARLSYTHSFGSDKWKKNKRATGSNEEQQRVN